MDRVSNVGMKVQIHEHVVGALVNVGDVELPLSVVTTVVCVVDIDLEQAGVLWRVAVAGICGVDLEFAGVFVVGVALPVLEEWVRCRWVAHRVPDVGDVVPDVELGIVVAAPLVVGVVVGGDVLPGAAARVGDVRDLTIA